MLRMSEEELSQVCDPTVYIFISTSLHLLQLEDPDLKAIPYCTKISAIDIYNAVCQKVMGETIPAPSVEDSVEIWMECLHEKGRETQYEKTFGKELQDGFTMAFVLPGSIRYPSGDSTFYFQFSHSLQLIAEYSNVVCLDSTHNTCGNKEEKVFLNTVLT